MRWLPWKWNRLGWCECSWETLHETDNHADDLRRRFVEWDLPYWVTEDNVDIVFDGVLDVEEETGFRFPTIDHYFEYVTVGDASENLSYMRYSVPD